MRIGKTGIGDDRAALQLCLLPGRERRSVGEGHLAAIVPVAVVAGDDASVPIPLGKRRVGIPPDDVALEAEADVVLDPRPLQLPVAGRSKDVVGDEVVFAVVLVETPRRRMMDDVVADHDPTRPLVGVQPPAAVVVADNVVDQIPLNGRAGGDPEGVDAPHVGEHAPAKVMDVVADDPVALCRARLVAPGPSHRDTGVGEVGDLAALDGGPVGLTDPDPDPRRMEAAAMGDRAVADRVLGDPGDRAPPRRDRPHHHPAGPQIEQFAAVDEAAAAADAKRQAVAADMTDPAADELHVAGPGERDGSADIEIPLRRRLAARGHRPVAMRERQADEADLVDCPSRERLPPHRDERVDARRYDLGCFRILAIEGAVGERAAGNVEIPRSRAPQRLADILEPVARASGEGPPGIEARRRADKLHVGHAALLPRLDRCDPHP